jgi:hypothetical protein
MTGLQQYSCLPGPCHGAVPARVGNGVAVAGMVLGILAVGLEWLGLITLGMSIAAVICGAVGISRAVVTGTGRGQGIAGVILGVLGLAAYIFWGTVSMGIMLLI